jgi:hypothetical protein
MIVASLLLILVAVTLLVLGLTGGSSALLISSIVASLLAAVALVIGARQASAARRAATLPAGDAARPPGRPGAPDLRADGYFADPQSAPIAGEEIPGEEIPGEQSPDEQDVEAPDRSAAYAAGPRTTGEHPARPDATQQVQPDDDLYDDDYGDVAGRTSSGQAAGPASPEDPDETPVAARADADDEFGEPDPEDPDDEPLPQAVRPADAVRMARLDAEVLVVDGRPRYHLADCAHLVGRLTEDLPVVEAVELGFSPCGLCRPVDRLVAAAARR